MSVQPQEPSAPKAVQRQTKSLVALSFTTELGAKYDFPDVSVDEAEQLASFFPSHYSNITLTNVSNACLVLPVRILTTLSIDGVERWRKNKSPDAP